MAKSLKGTGGTPVPPDLCGERGWRLHLGDAVAWLRTLPDACAHCVVSDPPYGTTDCAWDKGNAVALSDSLWSEMRRVVMPRGAFVLMACGQFTADLMMSRRALYRYKWVWHRGNQPTGILDVNHRPLRSHEDVLVFCEVSPAYYRVKHRGPERLYCVNGKSSNIYGKTGKDFKSVVVKSNEYDSTDVVFAAPPARGSSDRVHPTQKPVELMSLLVRSYCPEGGLVLDPFAGSGSTGVACLQDGRRFLGAELDKTIHAVATERLAAAEPMFAAAAHTHTHTHTHTLLKRGERAE